MFLEDSESEHTGENDDIEEELDEVESDEKSNDLASSDSQQSGSHCDTSNLSRTEQPAELFAQHVLTETKAGLEAQSFKETSNSTNASKDWRSVKSGLFKTALFA